MRTIATVGFVFLISVMPGRADLIATENVADFGTFSQLNAAVNGSNLLRSESCAPTSVANGLAYLSNTDDIPDLLLPGYGTVNALQTDMSTTTTGTPIPNIITGTGTYIGPSGQNVSPPVVIVGTQSTPTAMQLYNWLVADDAVEFGISWTGGGGHLLTLYGIDIGTGGTGTLSFLDPFGGTAGGTGSAVPITAATFSTIGGFLFINGGYNGGAASNGADPDNTGKSATGLITFDQAEGVPEPSALWVCVLSFGAIVLASLRRRVRC